MSKRIAVTVVLVLLIVIGVLAYTNVKMNHMLNNLIGKQAVMELEVERLALQVEETLKSPSDISGLSEVEGLLNQVNDKVTQLENELKDSSLEQVVNRIETLESEMDKRPIDQVSDVKSRFGALLSLFTGKQASQVNASLVKEAMGINENFYFEWYPEFESRQSIETIALMVQTVFQEGEGFEVDLVFEDNQEYLVKDSDGNAFHIYANEDGIYSIWSFAYVCDLYFAEFVEKLMKNDQQELFTFITYEAYDATPEDVKHVLDKFLKGIEEFDRTSMSYVFKGIEVDGFIFSLYDNEGHAIDFHVSHSDSITGIKRVGTLWGELYN